MRWVGLKYKLKIQINFDMAPASARMKLPQRCSTNLFKGILLQMFDAEFVFEFTTNYFCGMFLKNSINCKRLTWKEWYQVGVETFQSLSLSMIAFFGFILKQTRYSNISEFMSSLLKFEIYIFRD